MTVNKRLNVDQHFFAHIDTTFMRRRAHMRQQHDVIERQQFRVYGRVMFKDVEVCGQFTEMKSIRASI